MLSASIIIPTYNRSSLLKQALESIQCLRPVEGLTLEVIVVDNGSTDDTADVIQAIAAGSTIPIRRVLETKQGLNHGRNRGILSSEADWLIYLDDDMQVDPDWLHGFSDALKQFKPDAITGPVRPWFEEEPSPLMNARVLASVTSSYSLKGDQIKVLPTANAHELPGCNFAVRREVAIDIGGFHPSLDRSGASMLAGGDSEFGMRVSKAGKIVVYSPTCAIRHFVSRAKISDAGLRRRWEGLGATTRALEIIHGKPLTPTKIARQASRIIRFHARSAYFQVLGDFAEALRWQLEAIRLKGYLLKAPKGLSRVVSGLQNSDDCPKN